MSTASSETAKEAVASASGPLKSVWMAPKLAFRNLFHDILSLAVTLTGIVFSVVLVAVQCGLYIGAERTIAGVIDQIKTDLWVTPFGTKSFDDPAFMNGREKFLVLSTPGVAAAEDLVVNFANWRKPCGGNTAVLVVGANWNGPDASFKPWNIVQGNLQTLMTPNSVAVDDTYFKDLGFDGECAFKLGANAEIMGNRVTVTAVTTGIRSFTTLPYVFTTLRRAQSWLEATPDQGSYTLVRVAEGEKVEEVRKRLAARLTDNEVLTHQEFRTRSLNQWLFGTGAGGALIAGALLGLVVGIVIVAQTLYASTKDHLNEFATLRALGASASYIHQVILMQAMISAVVGYVLGMLLSLGVIGLWTSLDSTMIIVMTPGLAASLFAVTIGMCAIAAMSAILKVTRIDPAGVFSR
jgi:putative ABC transport system permease protein